MDEVIDDSVPNVHSISEESEREKTTDDENRLSNSLNERRGNENKNNDMQEVTNEMEGPHSSPKSEESELILPDSLTEDEEDMYKQMTEDGWEDILGSGRLKKRVLKEGKKGLASEGLGRPSRNDNVTVSLKGKPYDNIEIMLSKIILGLSRLIIRLISVGYFQDTLFEEIEELHFVTAEAEVVQAIDLCVVLMNTGEAAEIMADPEMAYGKFNSSY